jgi:hypothetical protein
LYHEDGTSTVKLYIDPSLLQLHNVSVVADMGTGDGGCVYLCRTYLPSRWAVMCTRQTWNNTLDDAPGRWPDSTAISNSRKVYDGRATTATQWRR